MEISKIVKKISLLHSTHAETPTNFDLSVEVLDHLNIDWADPNLKFLDPSCGRGTFLLAALQKLEQYGHTRKHIIENMLYGVDISIVQSKIAAKSLLMAADAKPNIYCSDSLTRVWDMEFDVIIGNPPFRDTENKAERWSLWIPFVLKSFNELVKPSTGKVAMITPVSWMAPNSDINNVILSNAEIINLDAGKFFNVGSTFSYYVLSKGTVSNTVNIVNDGNSLSVDRSTRFLPQTVNKLALSINEKTVFSSLPKFPFQRTTQHHTSKKEIFGKGNYDVFHTHAQTLKSITKMDEHHLYKVMFTLSGYPTALIDDNISCSQAVAWITIDSTEIAGADSYFNGKLVQYLIQSNKWSGWNNLEVIKSIPIVDLSTVLTDQDIYNLFNLTKDEIDYIESAVA